MCNSNPVAAAITKQNRQTIRRQHRADLARLK
jgi:hypothetical protein